MADAEKNPKENNPKEPSQLHKALDWLSKNPTHKRAGDLIDKFNIDETNLQALDWYSRNLNDPKRDKVLDKIVNNVENSTAAGEIARKSEEELGASALDSAEAAFFGAAKGASLNLFPHVEAGAKALGKLLREGKPFIEAYQESLVEARDFLQGVEAKDPTAFATGEIVGAIGSPAGRIVSGAQKLGKAGQILTKILPSGPVKTGMIEGAIAGGAEDGLAGAATGIVFGGVGGQISKVTGVAKGVRDFASKQVAKVLKPTPAVLRKAVKNLPGKTFKDKTQGLTDFVVENKLLADAPEDIFNKANDLSKELGTQIDDIVQSANDKGMVLLKDVYQKIDDKILKKLKTSNVPSVRAMGDKLDADLAFLRQTPVSNVSDAWQFRRDFDNTINWDKIMKVGGENEEKIRIALRGILNDEIDNAIGGILKKTDKKAFDTLRFVKSQYAKSIATQKVVADQVAKEFLDPEIHTKDIITAFALSRFPTTPGGKIALGAAGAVARKALRPVREKIGSTGTKVLKPLDQMTPQMVKDLQPAARKAIRRTAIQKGVQQRRRKKNKKK